MSGHFGVTVKSRVGTWFFSTAQDAEESARRMAVLNEQCRRRLALNEQLQAKFEAAAQEMQQREAAGKARRPARKREGGGG